MALYSKEIFLDSSMEEHSAVNRGVVGSSPTRGVKQNILLIKWILLYSFFCFMIYKIFVNILTKKFTIFLLSDILEMEL